jgi:Domain of unknown function (DUF5060)/Protein of unknown function (DUF4038)
MFSLALRPGLVAFLLVSSAPVFCAATISGELKQWHKVSLTFDGPQTSEEATPNPFFDYRLDVTFTHGRSGRTYTVPGFYAADGNAAESSAKSGNKWRAHFRPDEEGDWKYQASFRTGDKIAVEVGAKPGAATALDGASGSFVVRASDKKGADLRSKGVLRYVGEHYLRFAGTGEYFLKGGADSPENFLAYADFDDTYDADADSGSYKKVGPFIHKYEPHVKDWRQGNPTWKGGKGKGIIGALNYLASKGVNSVYFLTYNLDGGDGRDTWMWTGAKVRDRYDASKLDQWEIVFDHMDRSGIMLHVVTQETENDQALGGGPGLNPIRKLYYRELAARYAHHPALVWNLGEENDTPDTDRKEIAKFIRSVDPYRHPITVHTHANKELTFYDGILGDPNFEATSIQSAMSAYNRSAIALRRRSAEAGRKWVVFGDEQNPASHGVLPDESDPNHDQPRIHALWGNLLAGGSGVEWYFGHAFPHMDINCEDFRSRDRMWEQTRYALDFFRKHVPFHEMEPNNNLVSGIAEGRVLAQGDAIFVVQLPSGGDASLTLGSGSYRVQWFDPRTGGEFQMGNIQDVQGPGLKPIGRPPGDPDKDWIALVKR